MSLSHAAAAALGPPIDTRAVSGRRKLHFDSLDDMVVDAEKLVASAQTKMLGNWPLSQLLTHLAIAINGSIDGISARAPWFIRMLAPLIKRRLLKNGMSAGFRLPKKVEPAFFPTADSPQQALDQLRAAVRRTHTERMTARHPVLGKLTHDEWTRLHLRHGELHLSFALPG
ncbi:MAG TPA: DUF1569 domain-containing protein [Pirellulales bacterium]|nr:DUF1569 domain-containing protein [Pirellulales bacterium]